MNCHGQPILENNIIAQGAPFISNLKIDMENSILPGLPREIWDKIFGYLEFQNLKLFTEHKVKVLGKPLNGDEDNDRLMMGDTFIFEKSDFSKVVKNVFNIALCCKEFYLLTRQQRYLLSNAALRAKIDKDFLYEQTPTENKQKNNIKLIKPKKIKSTLLPDFTASPCKGFFSNLCRNPIPTHSLETIKTNIINRNLAGQTKNLFFENLKITPIALEPLKLISSDLNNFNPLIADKISVEVVEELEPIMHENNNNNNNQE